MISSPTPIGWNPKNTGFDDYLQYFIEVVMMEQQEMTREEAVKAITSYGNDAYTARGLEPGAKYWAVAVGSTMPTDTRRRSLPQKLLQRRLHPNPPIHSKSQRQQSHRQEHRLPLHRRTAMFTSWMFCRLTSSPRCRRVRIIKISDRSLFRLGYARHVSPRGTFHV